MDTQSPEFSELNTKIKKNRLEISKLNKQLSKLKSELSNNTKKLQSICNHKYLRECTTSGCYAEYDYICVYCNKYR